MQLVSKYLEVTSNKQQPLRNIKCNWPLSTMATLRTLERNLDFDNQVMITIIIIIIIIIIAFEPINEAVDLPTILGNNLWLTFFFSGVNLYWITLTMWQWNTLEENNIIMKNCRTGHLFLVMKLSSFETNVGLRPHHRVFFSFCVSMCVCVCWWGERGGEKPFQYLEMF